MRRRPERVGASSGPSGRNSGPWPIRHSGVALVTVLLIVAVTMAIAFEIANRHAFAVATSRQTLDGSQARQYALGGEQLARQYLHIDWKDEKTRTKDTLGEAWATSGEPFEVENGSISVRIVDLGSRFNLNSVLGADGAANLGRLKRLLETLELDPNLADAWLDWIDSDQEVHAFGAEDADYLLREPPYRAANQRAVHVSEPRLAMPFEKLEDFRRLRPHVTVLPTDTLEVNVNTATSAVLASLAPNFPPGDAHQLAQDARDFDAVEDLVAAYAPLGASTDVMVVGSRFFRVQVRAQFGESRCDLTSLVHRDTETGALDVLSRSFGERFEVPAQEDRLGEGTQA